MYLFIYSSLHVSSMVGGLPPTSTRHCHQHGVTITRSCIDTICFSWWWTWHSRNM